MRKIGTSFANSSFQHIWFRREKAKKTNTSSGNISALHLSRRRPVQCQIYVNCELGPWVTHVWQHLVECLQTSFLHFSSSGSSTLFKTIDRELVENCFTFALLLKSWMSNILPNISPNWIFSRIKYFIKFSQILHEI